MIATDSIAERSVYPNRLFADAATIKHVGEGLLARTLPRPLWTHEAHFAATLWLIRNRPDIDLDAQLRDIIWRYNESVGGENTDSAGYHHSLTMFNLALLRRFSQAHADEKDMLVLVNLALSRPFTRRDYPQHHYSDALLWSVAARRGWCAPDLVPLDNALI